ncbi:hypothetical protein BH24CHL6_BH24CHL6_15220 [soil metagenome]
MRRAAALLATLALLALPATALAHEDFTADLTGDAEVPPVTTDGTGSATATISDDESSIDFEVTFEGLSGPATMAHIHWGSADVAGPVIIWLTEVGVPDGSYESPLSGTATEAEFMAAEGGPQTFAEALDAIRDGNTYVNVHTEANPGGEVRGQLMARDHDHDDDPPLPDTHAHAAGAEASTGVGPTILLLAFAGLAVFALGLRRFAARQA